MADGEHSLEAAASASSYLLNRWYACALQSELAGPQPLARTLLGRRLALFRGASGKAVALDDQCPHRFAPLHMGTVRDGTVECLYHGLRFDGQGRCVANPHGDGRIPPRAQVRSYPTLERHGLVWFWPGAPGLAAPELAPDLSALDDAAHPHARISGYMHTPAHYELIIDNLMDLSHADFLHRDSLNTGGALSRLRPEIRSGEDTVSVHWRYRTATPQPFFRSALADLAGEAEQSFDMAWTAPANLLLKVTAGDVARPPEAAAVYNTAHLLTPETETSTHYFVLGWRSWNRDDAELNAALGAALMAAFELEDRPMLAAVQAAMGSRHLWSMDPVVLSSDAGAIGARRLLARLISREQRGRTCP